MPVAEPKRKTRDAAKPNPAEDLLATHLKELGIEFTRQYQFYSRRQWKVDFFLPAYSVCVECEGAVWVQGGHTRGQGFIDDCEKYNFATGMGLKVFRFPTQQVLNGDAKEFLRTWLKEKAP